MEPAHAHQFPMKKFLVLSFSVFLGTFAAQAGNFFGPGPFRGGSPLPSGTDGVYQAVATAPNLTGLFSWAISGGVQTAAQQNNRWVFFVDGQLLSGTTVANISEGKVSGVLDSGLGNGIPTNENGTVDLPIAFVIPGNSAGGQFEGKIDLNSPTAAFEGDGTLQGTPDRVDQLIYILDLSTFDSVAFGSDFNPIFYREVIIPGTQFNPVTGRGLPTSEFTFRGTRLSTTGTAPTQQSQVPAIPN